MTSASLSFDSLCQNFNRQAMSCFILRYYDSISTFKPSTLLGPILVNAVMLPPAQQVSFMCQRRQLCHSMNSRKPEVYNSLIDSCEVSLLCAGGASSRPIGGLRVRKLSSLVETKARRSGCCFFSHSQASPALQAKLKAGRQETRNAAEALWCPPSRPLHGRRSGQRCNSPGQGTSATSPCFGLPV